MTLDGFLPETDNVLMRWVMNHRKGFARWRERCDARILPYYILDLLCEKDTKGDSFIYLAEVSDAETLDLLRGLFHYNLVEELIIYLFPYSAGKGNSIQAIFPVRQWQLHKAVVLPGGICRLIIVILAGCNLQIARILASCKVNFPSNISPLFLLYCISTE